MTDGKVLWHVTMSLDGFIADTGHGMGWATGAALRPGLFEEMVAATGAILSGRRGYDAGVKQVGAGNTAKQAYGGAFDGPVFVLTHHPEDTVPEPGLTFLDCDLGSAVATGLAAARGKNLEVFGADLARQCLELDLIDEFFVHLVPVMLGDGVRLFDAPGVKPVLWQRIGDGDPALSVDLRYRPVGRG
ncbi:dihydrofolate reductase family protein [Amycolatopsis sp. 195334CR]|uniref:dihydrofolate reductase family protein n=1 Tax=Amycolatopsis sp. 195334CR TaxID=2814588 RepID=UPI001A8DE43D|nr:dihydrofolate reductase family protein [Amycolatopsis sp. 195334CR]MBN6039493.1 dihydrofolate reductase family protein [Amycolatopsis sp. 195334CR]